MKKNFRRTGKPTLPEIQEEGLLTPLRRGASFSAYAVAHHKLVIPSLRDLESGSDHNLHSNVEMAAALVDQAMQGRYLPLAVVYHKDYESAKRAFLLHHQLYLARGIVYLILMFLPFFEIPAWCNGEMPNPCGDFDGSAYALSRLPYIHPLSSLMIEVLCVLTLVWSVTLQWYFMGPSFWRNPVAVYKVILLIAMAIAISSSAAGIAKPQGIKFSMYLRILVPIVFSRALRNCFCMTLRIGLTFMDIMVLVVAFMLVSAWLGTALFSDYTAEFKDYVTSLFNLFVLLTTANNPTVWATVYSANRLSFFFFFTYLIIGFFFLMSLAFSVVYSNYKSQMVIEVAKRITARQGNLRAAFGLLDIKHQEWIDGATMIALFLAIGRYSSTSKSLLSSVLPSSSRHIPDVRARTSRLFLALNKRGDFKIWSDEFEELCDVIAKEVERKPGAQTPGRYRRLSDMHFVKHPCYAYVIWAFTFASLAVAIVQLNVDGRLQILLLSLEFLFGWVFAMDTMLKICVQGWKPYWWTSLNRFDFVVTVLIVCLHLFSFFYHDSRNWVSYLIIMRGFRIFTLVTLVSRWWLVAQTLLYAIPATAPVLVLQFLVCSFFSLLGMHLFGGLVYAGNPALQGTEYLALGYDAFNYNDFASAMVTSFNLCVANKWYVIMDAYAAATGNRWVQSFFIAFWVLAVAFMLNVVLAFFVEAFTSQMEKEERARVHEQREMPGQKKSGGILPFQTTKSSSCDIYEDGTRYCT